MMSKIRQLTAAMYTTQLHTSQALIQVLVMLKLVWMLQYRSVVLASNALMMNVLIFSAVLVTSQVNISMSRQSL